MFEPIELTPKQWVFYARREMPFPTTFERPQAEKLEDAAELKASLDKLYERASDPNLVSACLHVLKGGRSSRRVAELFNDIEQDLKAIRKRLDRILKTLRSIYRVTMLGNLPKRQPKDWTLDAHLRWLQECTQMAKETYDREGTYDAFEDALVILVHDFKSDGHRLPKGFWPVLAESLRLLGYQVSAAYLRLQHSRIKGPALIPAHWRATSENNNVSKPH